MGEKVYIFLAEGFEEIEAVATIDVLNRGGLEVIKVSITGDKVVCGAHGITIVCDSTFDECEMDDGLAYVLPGGLPGTENLKAHEGLGKLLIKENGRGKLIAAICAAPSVLGGLGLLKNKTATCYPGWESKLEGANLSIERVVQDGNIVTSRAAGTTVEFALKLVEILKDKVVAEKIKSSMLVL